MKAILGGNVLFEYWKSHLPFEEYVISVLWVLKHCQNKYESPVLRLFENQVTQTVHKHFLGNVNAYDMNILMEVDGVH